LFPLAELTDAEPRTFRFEPLNSILQCAADAVVDVWQTPPGVSGAQVRLITVVPKRSMRFTVIVSIGVLPTLVPAQKIRP
jgi:hypothetical protein